MRITGDQLKAIEKAIGRDAKVTLEIEYSIQHVGAVLRVEVCVEGESLVFATVSSHAIPLRTVANNLVDKVNRELTNKAFREVKW